MNQNNNPLNRRKFIKHSSMYSIVTGAGLVLPLNSFANSNIVSSENDLNIIGSKTGYTPQVGTLVSMLNWMRHVILTTVQGMSTENLDYVYDENSNSIGAMLLHLAATERYYQIHTFEGKKWGDWPKDDIKEWSVASGLGERARKKIKGHQLNYYIDKLTNVRNNTLKELAKRDDEWLLNIDSDWPWGPTNNYCKWFHVCEHESNHNGQMKWIKRRLPAQPKR